jgi:hypothetical protein
MIRLAAILVMLLPVLGVEAGAQARAIDAERSTLTVLVYKSGLFSAFADDHVIRAPIASGSISDVPPLAVQLTVRPADFVVLDPGLSASKRAEVRERMLGPEVLDSTRYPEITFASTAVQPDSADRWTVRGALAIRGATRPMAIQVIRQDGRYRGSVRFKQSDFGIRPISIVGGTVKVKDELKIEFDIAPESTRAQGMNGSSGHRSIRQAVSALDVYNLRLSSSRALRPPPQTPPARRSRSVGRKVLGGVIGGVGGFFGGGYLGAAIEGDRCECDDPGFVGFLIGAPVGAAVGAIVGVKFF